MRRIRGFSLGLVAILAGCAPGSVPATATPTASSASATPTASAAPGTATASPAPATSAPSSSPTQSVVPTAVLPTAPAGLTGRLLFSRFIEETHTFSGMFAAAPDGSGEDEVPLPWEEGGGRWSLSGDEIAVPTQLDDGRIGTAIIDTTGTLLRELEIADEGLNLVCTTWSPDDARLACEGWDDSDETRGGIYTVRSSDGGEIERLTPPPPPGMRDLNGDWASDGTVVYKRYRGDEAPGELFLIDGGGGEPTPLTSGAKEDPGRFSPDGTLIATSTGGVIEVYDRSGARVSAIEIPGSFLFGPAWSPDGAWLAFSKTADGQFAADLFIARPDGADIYQVTRTSANEIAVDWGADPG